MNMTCNIVVVNEAPFPNSNTYPYPLWKSDLLFLMSNDLTKFVLHNTGLKTMSRRKIVNILNTFSFSPKSNKM